MCVLKETNNGQDKAHRRFSTYANAPKNVIKTLSDPVIRFRTVPWHSAR